MPTIYPHSPSGSPGGSVTRGTPNGPGTHGHLRLGLAPFRHSEPETRLLRWTLAEIFVGLLVCLGVVLCLYILGKSGSPENPWALMEELPKGCFACGCALPAVVVLGSFSLWLVGSLVLSLVGC